MKVQILPAELAPTKTQRFPARNVRCVSPNERKPTMATALKVVPAPPEPAGCGHLAFNAYQTFGGYPDDIVTERGKCAGCQCWLEITTWLSTDYSEERALDAGEISQLLRAELI